MNKQFYVEQETLMTGNKTRVRKDWFVNEHDARKLYESAKKSGAAFYVALIKQETPSHHAVKLDSFCR